MFLPPQPLTADLLVRLRYLPTAVWRELLGGAQALAPGASDRWEALVAALCGAEVPEVGLRPHWPGPGPRVVADALLTTGPGARCALVVVSLPAPGEEGARRLGQVWQAARRGTPPCDGLLCLSPQLLPPRVPDAAADPGAIRWLPFARVARVLAQVAKGGGRDGRVAADLVALLDGAGLGGFVGVRAPEAPPTGRLYAPARPAYFAAAAPPPPPRYLPRRLFDVPRPSEWSCESSAERSGFRYPAPPSAKDRHE